MAGIHETQAPKAPVYNTFGGRRGSKKTLWLALVVTMSVVAVGAFYVLPQVW